MENQEQRCFKLLTKAEAAEYLGVSQPTFDNIMREPGFPVVRLGVRRVFINREKLDEWIDARTAIDEYPDR